MTFRESETVELKSIVVDDIKKELIAFANTSGGTLYVGVQDDGTVIGVDDTDEVILQIGNMVRDGIKPDLTMFLHYEVISCEGKEIAAVTVQRGTNRPYYISKKGLRPEGVYVRQGNSAAPATDTAIRQMIKETDGDRYEEMRSIMQDLTFEAAQREFDRRSLPFAEPQMRTLGLINSDSVYTNLGLLLSDQCMHTVKAAVFQGTDPLVFKNRKEFTGSLFRQMEDLYSYIDFYNQTRSTFEGLYRQDQRDYPETAVREAMLNMLVHREYGIAASASVSIYKDRMEFLSVGGLVNGIAISDVMMGVSVCRNAGLANVFYRLELIEAYGTGIRKIMSAYSGSGMTPEIKTSENAFCIILPNRNEGWSTREMAVESQNEAGMNASAIVRERSLQGMQAVMLHENSGVYRAGVLSDGAVGQQRVGTQIAFTDDTQQVLDLVREQGQISRKDVENLLQVSQATGNRLIRQMQEQGLLMQRGKGKRTRYYLP